MDLFVVKIGTYSLENLNKYKQFSKILEPKSKTALNKISSF